MTLIVSLRIPDGIVLAGDSLATLMGQSRLEATIGITCPQCNHEHDIQQIIPLPSAPATTFSYAQKVFPFCEKFGVGTFGRGLLAGKSIYFAMRLLEQRFKEGEKSFTGVTEVAREMGDEIHNLLKEHLAQENASLEDLPEDQIVLGFQIVGYDNIEAKTIETYIGKKVHFQVFDDLGCTASGSREIVDVIWELDQKHPGGQPPYPVFSLQDAIDYAEFLIRTTSVHQQLSRSMSSVGGDIDIALVTPFDGFRWIRQKPLGNKILEET